MADPALREFVSSRPGRRPSAHGLDGERDRDRLERMLFSLQLQASQPHRDWQHLHSTMDALVCKLAEDEVGQPGEVDAAQWQLELGPIDLSGDIITLQRDEELLAAMRANQMGGLVLASYYPLDSMSLNKLMALGVKPHPRHGVAMRENNWQFALDQATAMGNHYAADRGEPYLAHWRHGLGLSVDGGEVFGWCSQRHSQPATAAQTAVQLDVCYRWEKGLD